MDINVNISDTTAIVTSDGFGLALVVGTTSNHVYKEYDISENLSAVLSDFNNTTEVYKIVSTFASQSPRPQKIAILGVDLSASSQKATDLVTALDSLISANNNWYRLILEDKTEALIAAVSSWAETNHKIFYTIFSNTTFATDFTSKNRTVLQYKENSDRIDAAMCGRAATRIPGSYIFKFKGLANITADAITATELTAIKAKNMNCYRNKFEVLNIGKSQLESGKVASGMYIDQVESRDWVNFRIQQEIASALMTSEKIPYDDTGIQQIVSCVKAALSDAVDNEIIAKDNNGRGLFTIKYKNVNQIPSTDRAQRKLTGISFSYVEASGIESVDPINGYVTLEL